MIKSICVKPILSLSEWLVFILFAEIKSEFPPLISKLGLRKTQNDLFEFYLSSTNQTVRLLSYDRITLKKENKNRNLFQV